MTTKYEIVMENSPNIIQRLKGINQDIQALSIDKEKKISKLLENSERQLSENFSENTLKIKMQEISRIISDIVSIIEKRDVEWRVMPLPAGLHFHHNELTKQLESIPIIAKTDIFSLQAIRELDFSHGVFLYAIYRDDDCKLGQFKMRYVVARESILKEEDIVFDVKFKGE